MKGSRFTVGTAIALGLFAGSTIAVIAQDEGVVTSLPVERTGPIAAESGRVAFAEPRVVLVAAPDERTRDLTIDSPSVGEAKVRLLLPAGFEEDPEATYPVLYLLHGAWDDYTSWTRETDVEELTADLDLLVVMPDGGREGFYSDWWNGGEGGPPAWETFHLDEVRDIIERDWRASDERIIAGLSMGGYGTMHYATAHPELFKAAAAFSGVLDPVGADFDLGRVLWGDRKEQAENWAAHDPVAMAEALRGKPLYVSWQDGEPGPLDPQGRRRTRTSSRPGWPPRTRPSWPTSTSSASRSRPRPARARTSGPTGSRASTKRCPCCSRRLRNQTQARQPGLIVRPAGGPTHTRHTGRCTPRLGRASRFDAALATLAGWDDQRPQLRRAHPRDGLEVIHHHHLPSGDRVPASIRRDQARLGRARNTLRGPPARMSAPCGYRWSDTRVNAGFGAGVARPRGWANGRGAPTATSASHAARRRGAHGRPSRCPCRLGILRYGYTVATLREI